MNTSTTNYLISLLTEEDGLKFVVTEPEPALSSELNEAASWESLEEARGYRNALMEGFQDQGYRVATAEEVLADPEDQGSGVVQFTILKSVLEPVLTAHLVKE